MTDNQREAKGEKKLKAYLNHPLCHLNMESCNAKPYENNNNDIEKVGNTVCGDQQDSVIECYSDFTIF